MFNLSLVVKKTTSFLIISLLSLSILACGSGDSNVNTTPIDDKGGVSLPQELKTTLLIEGTLNAYIIVDGGSRQPMTINGDNANVSLSGLTEGPHTFVIEFEYIVTANPGSSLMLARVSQDLDVGAGNNTLNINETDYDTSYDDDNDGRSNIAELASGENPFAGYTISNITGNTTEDGDVARFSIVLTRPLSSDVSFDVSSSNPNEGTVNPAQITFTAADWNQPQTISITGVDDDAIDGSVIYSIILSAMTSEDSNYNGEDPADVSVTNIDNDSAGFNVSPINRDTNESGITATFSVRLNTQPTADVVLGLSSSNTAEGVVDKANLTFTSANWSTLQTVTVTGVDDNVLDGNQTYSIDFAAAVSNDNNYNNLAAGSVGVVNLDNEGELRVSLSIRGSSSINENSGTATLVATMSSASNQDVTINLSYRGSASADDYTRVNSITIAGGTGATSGTVDINTKPDTIDEPNENIIVDISSVVNALAANAPGPVITIVDDDALPEINFTSGAQTVSENVNNVAVNLTLSNPSASVITVPYTVTGTASGGGVDHNLVNGNITFAASDATAMNTTASIRFTIQNDDLVEVDEDIIITLGQPSNARNGVGVHTLTITDNDYSIGVSASGVDIVGLVLQNNATNDLDINTDGNFTFANGLESGSTYEITVSSNPVGRICVLSNATGTVNSSNISNISVACSSMATLTATPQYRSVQLDWNNIGVESYNLYYSTDKAFNADNYASFNNGTLLTNVSTPLNISNLQNDTAYYFILEAISGTQNFRSSVIASRPNELVFDGPIETMATAADGTLFLGGRFTQVGINTGKGIPLSTVTGRSIAGDFPLVNGRVYTAVPDGAGGWFIGGSFTNVGGLARNNLAHILADNSVNANWNPNANGVVSTLSVDGSTVYVGGNFSSIGGITRNRLAAIGTDGSLSSWNPNASGFVSTLSVDGSTVYVGGTFSSMGGITRNRLAAIGTDGSLSSWNPNASGFVSTLSVDGSTVYVGGSFSSMGGITRNRLAAIGTDGSLSSWNPNASGEVNTLSVDGSTVYVGGSFSLMGGITRNSLAAIGTDGSLSSWNPNASGEVNTLSVDGSTVYVGGAFSSIGGITRNRLAAIGTDGSLSSWSPNANSVVSTLSVDGSTVYVGGAFTSMGGITRNRLAAIGTDGSLSSWNPNANSFVNTLSVDGSTVYVGGAFSSIGGITRGRLAAIGTDGSLSSWNPNASSTVTTLSVDGSTVYVGGNFSSMDGITRNSLAAIGTDGSLSSWNPNANSFVNTLSVDGSTVYVGGFFTSMGGITRNRLAAIGTDGTLSSWNPNADSTVTTLSVDGSTVYVGGFFSSMGGITRSRLAAIGTDGSLSSWNPNASSAVTTLSVDGSTVYVGGFFSSMGGITRSRLAAIGTDGSLSSWNPNANSVVYTLSVDGSTVYVGGNFSSMGGITRNRLAAIGTDGALQ